ncbi:serine/threonine-protein kinase [Pedosphaera parvula]|uniref:Serine/threonine protein kinase n=1 Tax=Pedosphaera parvula (strain Ellin514) TaxID=320771 RepID=B9XBT0_PEDPL|nr:serine/threonine-protein kinase [Pedosphaera parvula]EEF62965.1 serine/threonine protein kinase [Pedosphaera parvula Ellin514]
MELDSERLKEIFSLALLRKSPSEQECYLAEACHGDAELRRQVESLLQAHEQAGEFLGQAGKLLPSSFRAECAGAMIGRYKLLELIGEGGFGTVWMAEQVEPVRRRLALKVIKPGMDTKQVLARFEAERQALAMMDHPSIARVFDGGATDNGRPYFVMELVRGIRITDYCDANKLSTRERLLLFIQVCQAVEHAHQKGIIHRDLKPSNVLVTEVDGAPVPKVIDFGVAKAMQARLTELTLFTGLHQMIGTPSYMSPEQAGLGALDMDTRSDIYGLGVLLYELLTGQTPLTKEEFDKAGLDEIFRLVRERDPQKPSTRLSALTREELTTVAAQRQAEPAKLNRLLTGDLDWIVMKALEKDRRRRYENASSLASDLVRHLNNEPVMARPPSNMYRLQKAWRRNQTVFASAIMIALVLVSTTGISVWQAIRATRAETLAKQRLAESEAISKSLSDMSEHSFTVGLMDDNRPIFAFDDAGRHAAIDLREQILVFNIKVHGLEAPDTISAMENLADSYEGVHRIEEAIKLREEVLTFRRKMSGPSTVDTINAMGKLAGSYYSAGRSREATALLENVCELEPTNSLASLRLAALEAWFGQGTNYEATRRRLVDQPERTNNTEMEKHDAAIYAERAAKVYCLLPSADAARQAKVLHLAQLSVELGDTNDWGQLALGMAEYRNGQYAAAEHSLKIVEQAMADKRPEVQGTARLFRAISLFRQNKPAEARKLFGEAEAQIPFPADERRPFAEQGIFSPYNQELLICWLAVREARSLLKR